MIQRFPVSDNNLSLGFKLKHFIKGLQPYSRKSPEILNTLWMGSFTPELRQGLFSDTEAQQADWMCIYEGVLIAQERKRSVNRIDRVIENLINFYLQEDILLKVDRASMANSLEVRAPFLDKQLAEFICRLPVDFKMKGLRRKAILKHAFKMDLPEQIINRPKKGFGIPISQWFKGPLREMVSDTLSCDRIKRDGILNHRFVSRLLQDHLSNKRDNRKELWSLFIFQLWYNQALNRN